MGMIAKVSCAMPMAKGSATVVEHDGRITGYATIVGFFGHAVGESRDDVKALIAAAKEFAGPGFLLPTARRRIIPLVPRERPAGGAANDTDD